MVVLDYSARAVTAFSFHGNLDIEFVGSLGQSYGNPVVPDHFLCLGNRLFVQVVQDFKTVFRPAAYGSEGCGDMQAHHAGTRYSDSHSVLENVAAYLYLEAIV